MTGRQRNEDERGPRRLHSSSRWAAERRAEVLPQIGSPGRPWKEQEGRPGGASGRAADPDRLCVVTDRGPRRKVNNNSVLHHDRVQAVHDAWRSRKRGSASDATMKVVMLSN